VTRVTGHLFVRLVGFGAIVLPYPPFRVTRATSDGRRVRIETPAGDAVLDFPGHTPTAIANIVDVLAGSSEDDWRLETSVYSCPWPQGFAITSTSDAASPARFDLVGAGDSLIYVQGPFAASRRPRLTDLAAPGQTVRSSGRLDRQEWIRLAYRQEEVAWEQAHVLVQLGDAVTVAVTMQAPEQHAEVTFLAARTLAEQMRVA